MSSLPKLVSKFKRVLRAYFPSLMFSVNDSYPLRNISELSTDWALSKAYTEDEIRPLTFCANRLPVKIINEKAVKKSFFDFMNYSFFVTGM